MTTTANGGTRSPFLTELDRISDRMDAAWRKQQEIEAAEPFDRVSAEAAGAEYFAAMNDYEQLALGERPHPED